MSGPRLVSESVPRIAGKVFSRKYIMLGRLVTHWSDIVGPELAGKARPVKLRYARNGKGEGKPAASLDIETPGSADAMVLHYQKDLILERINRIFGERWVTSIRFVPAAANASPSPSPLKKRALTAEDHSFLAGLIEEIGDTEIRERLNRLGTAILQDASS